VNIEDLKNEVGIELDLFAVVVRELVSLKADIGDHEPTMREITAAAGFLAQFYNGIENILKRISRFNDVPLPTGAMWHVELFKRFCTPPFDPLPALFDEPLAQALSPFRKFRHVVHHGYGFQLDWVRMKEGISTLEDIFYRFKTNILNYLKLVSQLNHNP
jgi:hypothetical protein